MKRFTCVWGAAAALILVATPVASQGSGLSGVWSVDSSALLPKQNEPCVYEGTAELTQSNNMISGPLTQNLVSGPTECPDVMAADLQGEVIDGTVSGSLDSPELGLAGFNGDIDPTGMGISGQTTVETGPFSGVASDWLAEFLGPIPALAPVAVAILSLLLIVTGALVILRHRST